MKAPASPKLTFTDGFANEFATPIPESFAEAVRRESLNQGDIFFSHRAAYEPSNWDEALKQIDWAVQIKESMTGGRVVLFQRYTKDSASAKLIADGVFQLRWENFLERLAAGKFTDL